jgi:type II secretion system protein G
MNQKYFYKINFFKGKQSGFTLVELLLVIGIIGILSGAIVSIVNPVAQFEKARDSQRKNDLAQIQRALEGYHQDFGQYPAQCNSGLKHSVRPYINDVLTCIEWGGTWDPYMKVLPRDPDPDKSYIYDVDDWRQSYRLYTSLDRGGLDEEACLHDDPSCLADPDSEACLCQGIGSEIDITVCGGVCNYGVSSPNISP